MSGVPVAGQFAVVRGLYDWDLVAVESVTGKQFKGISCRHYKRACTTPIRSCCYCGDEASARALLENLVSSDAQCQDERRKANDRRIVRDQAMIALAVTKQVQP